MVASTLWKSRLAAASRPIAPMNAVSARPTGRSAASSAPNATIRMPRVSGRESSDRREKSFSRLSPITLSPLAKPTWATYRSGCAFCTLATASITGATRSAAVSASPVMSNVTNAECLSAEMTAGCRFSTRPVPLTAAVTSATADWNAGAPLASRSLCTSTISPACSGNPAASIIWSARRDSPLSYSLSEAETLPMRAISAVAATTNSSQPPIAVARCRALNWAIRAARLPGGRAR
jgi:hypothetical protein